MPIVGENRIIVAEGLKKLSVTANIGLEMLLREAGMKNRRLTSSTISYVLAPRINAAGRMGKAELAAELFLTKDPVRAQALAAELCEQNKLRQNEENKILEQTLTRLRREYNPLEDKIIVLARRGLASGRYRHRVLTAVRPLRLSGRAHLSRRGRRRQGLRPLDRQLQSV